MQVQLLHDKRESALHGHVQNQNTYPKCEDMSVSTCLGKGYAGSGVSGVIINE